MPVYLAEHSSVPLGKGEARQLVSFPEGTHEDVTRTFVNGGYRASQMYLPSRALNALIQSWQWVALVFHGHFSAGAGRAPSTAAAAGGAAVQHALGRAPP
jgi:hypothetical protein